MRRYQKVGGECPVQEFLDEQRASNPDGYAALIAGIRKLRDRKYHRPPLSERVDDQIFELKALPFRLFYAFRPGKLIVLLSGLRKKSRKLPEGEVKLARRYLEDYEQRCGHDEERTDEDFDK